MSYSDVGAASSSHTHSYLPLSGGTISGDLSVTGSITASGNITAYSDIRLKSDVLQITDALHKVSLINGYTFTMNDKRSTGLIAQELEKVLPEAVVKTDTEEGYLSIAYGNVVGLLVEAIKEQQKEIEELKSLINK